MSDRVVPGNPKPITNAALQSALADMQGGDAEGSVAQYTLRKATAVEWETENPTLPEGVVGYDQTHKQQKIGDGVTAWRQLPYASLTRCTKTTLGDPADIAPSAYTQSQKNSFREPYSTLVAWNPSSAAEHGEDDEAIIYIKNGYNAQTNVHNEPVLHFNSFESYYYGYMELHTDGFTKPHGSFPQGQYFRCDGALYPRERYDHPEYGVDVSSIRSFAYQRINFGPLSADGLTNYTGFPYIVFDFRAGECNIELNAGNWNISAPNYAMFRQKKGSGEFGNLPYLDALGVTKIDEGLSVTGTATATAFNSTNYQVGFASGFNSFSQSTKGLAVFYNAYDDGTIRRKNAIQSAAIVAGFSGLEFYFGASGAADSEVPLLGAWDSNGLVVQQLRPNRFRSRIDHWSNPWNIIQEPGSSASRWRGLTLFGGDICLVGMGEANNQAWIAAYDTQNIATKNLYIQPEGTTQCLIGSATQIRVDNDGGKLGFFNAAGVAKPTVSGSRSGNAALESLCSALANLGLITNSTT